MSTSDAATIRARALRPGRRLSIDLDRIRSAAPLSGLLLLTALLYLWALARNGWGNQYYAAAVQAGTHSWKAFLFGSMDASNYITVDKPPASLWLMELSGRVFGLSSFSMLLPQALEGVAAVALVYGAVRRWFGKPAALLSGLILALTPVAALMFRFNNPDALLVLLMVAAAYAVTRAIEHGSTRWLALAGAALGFGFLTKELQIFLVVPALALAYIVAAPGRLRRRLWQLAIAGATMIVTAGWWVALVELWPASARPYIGDSTNNSVLQLIFGLNGLDRISSAGGGPGGGFSGSAGILRLFNSELGGQISWLLPATAIALVAGAIWTRHRPRTDCTRAALLLWGGWFGVTAVVYSFMTGIIHPYYTNVLAPAIAVLLGVGTVVLWRRRDQLHARALSAAMLATTGLWSFVLLDRDPSWHPWLRFAVLVGSLIAAGALLAGRRVAAEPRTALATVGLVAALAGPAAYTLSTVATAQAGQNPTAGPAAATTGPHPGAGAHETTASRALVSLIDQNASRYKWVAASTDWQTAAAIQLAGGKPVMAIGGFTGFDNMTLTKFKHLVATHRIHYYVAGGGFGGPGGFSGPGRHGFSGAFAPPSGAGFVPPPGTRLGPPPGTRFGPPPGNGFGPPPGAGFGPAIGSFGRGGPGGGRGGPGGPGGPGGGRGAQASIQSWVSAHFRSQTLGGVTVYDLSQPKS